MGSFEIRPIGIVKSPYKSREDAPFQGSHAPETKMKIEIFEEFRDGLGDFAGTSHIIVLLWFDQAERNRLTAKPPWTDTIKPVFTTRSPSRPNPVGLDIAKIISVRDGVITVSGMDAIEGTPVVDIKPYVPWLDCIQDATYPR